MAKRRQFRRRKPKLDYRKLFVIAMEGRKTEPEYFGLFNSKVATIRLKLLPSKHDGTVKKPNICFPSYGKFNSVFF